MLYGLLQHRFKLYKGALESYRAAGRLRPDDAVVHYNTGLVLIDMKRYPDAAKMAKKAYDMQFPLQGLKKKLIAAGYWDAKADKPRNKPVGRPRAPAKAPNQQEPTPPTGGASPAAATYLAPSTLPRSSAGSDQGVAPPVVEQQTQGKP